jgi:acetyl-CoA synthetase (ADP-forming)
MVQESLVKDLSEARAAAQRIGFPVVLKACSPAVAHKTERGLIAVNLRDEAELSLAFDRIVERAGGMEIDFLVQEMIHSDRELVMGMTRDPQFGPCVMFGLGGIFTEALGDVSFRVAPLTQGDALEMLQEINGHKILSEIRGMAEINRDALAGILVSIGQIGLDHEKIREIDINPVLVRDSRPIGVDALVVLQGAL